MAPALVGSSLPSTVSQSESANGITNNTHKGATSVNKSNSSDQPGIHCFRFKTGLTEFRLRFKFLNIMYPMYLQLRQRERCKSESPVGGLQWSDPRRNIVGYSPGQFVALLLCWERGQQSPIHDHAGDRDYSYYSYYSYYSKNSYYSYNSYPESPNRGAGGGAKGPFEGPWRRLVLANLRSLAPLSGIAGFAAVLAAARETPHYYYYY